MKVVVAAFNQEKALVGAFSVLTNLRMDLFQALIVCDIHSDDSHWSLLAWLLLPGAGSRPGGAGTMVAMVWDCSWLSTSASYWSPAPLHSPGQ